MSVFALGIMPYITASIILQLLTVVIPRLEALKNEGQAGTAKITQYTRYLTIGLGVLQSTGYVELARSGRLYPSCSENLIPNSSIFTIATMVVTMVSGTAVIMWMGELITDRGVGNGMSVLIFTQVIAVIPGGLLEMIAQCDYVVVAAPLTPQTRGMIGAREFAAMQRHAYFITTARGFIHDEAALVEALRGQLIAGAGLDVWAKEPPPPDHPLLQFDNVLASPHTAGVTTEARENMGRIAAEQMLDALDGKRPPRIINPEVWPDYARRFERTFGFKPA